MTGIIIGMVFGILGMLIIFILYIFYSIKFNRQKNRIKLIGIKAEKEINEDLNKWSKKNSSLFIGTNLFRYDTNKVFEVDGIVLTPCGIIVVEIKSINGTIIGDADDSKWVKKLKYITHDITNPLKQNDRHIKHIQKILDEKVPIISLVIFSNRAENLELTNIPEYAIVIRHANLFPKLDKIKEVLKPALSNKDLKKIKKTIYQYRTNSKYSRNLHDKITGRIE